jgi:hypothetical protein
MDNYGSRCDTRHPSGECCLPQIKQIIREKTIAVEERKRAIKQDMLKLQERRALESKD